MVVEQGPVPLGEGSMVLSVPVSENGQGDQSCAPGQVALSARSWGGWSAVVGGKGAQELIFRDQEFIFVIRSLS